MTDLAARDDHQFGFDSPTRRTLTAIGYSVGYDSPLSPRGRREVLSDVFQTDTCKSVLGKNAGIADSAARLYRLARLIATCCQFARGKNSPALDDAIRDWSSDLEWLRSNFYYGRFEREFKWPRAIC